jgi:hypothetical protein
MNYLCDIDFIGICDTYDFWKLILSANDTYAEKISTHSWVQRVKVTIQQTAISLIEGTVALPVLKNIAAHKNRLETLGLAGPFDQNVLVYLNIHPLSFILFIVCSQVKESDLQPRHLRFQVL